MSSSSKAGRTSPIVGSSTARGRTPSLHVSTSSRAPGQEGEAQQSVECPNPSSDRADAFFMPERPQIRFLLHNSTRLTISPPPGGASGAITQTSTAPEVVGQDQLHEIMELVRFLIRPGNNQTLIKFMQEGEKLRPSHERAKAQRSEDRDMKITNIEKQWEEEATSIAEAKARVKAKWELKRAAIRLEREQQDRELQNQEANEMVKYREEHDLKKSSFEKMKSDIYQGWLNEDQEAEANLQKQSADLSEILLATIDKILTSFDVERTLSTILRVRNSAVSNHRLSERQQCSSNPSSDVPGSCNQPNEPMKEAEKQNTGLDLQSPPIDRFARNQDGSSSSNILPGTSSNTQNLNLAADGLPNPVPSGSSSNTGENRILQQRREDQPAPIASSLEHVHLPAANPGSSKRRKAANTESSKRRRADNPGLLKRRKANRTQRRAPTTKEKQLRQMNSDGVGRGIWYLNGIGFYLRCQICGFMQYKSVRAVLKHYHRKHRIVIDALTLQEARDRFGVDETIIRDEAALEGADISQAPEQGLRNGLTTEQHYGQESRSLQSQGDTPYLNDTDMDESSSNIDPKPLLAQFKSPIQGGSHSHSNPMGTSTEEPTLTSNATVQEQAESAPIAHQMSNEALLQGPPAEAQITSPNTAHDRLESSSQSDSDEQSADLVNAYLSDQDSDYRPGGNNSSSKAARKLQRRRGGGGGGGGRKRKRAEDGDNNDTPNTRPNTLPGSTSDLPGNTVNQTPNENLIPSSTTEDNTKTNQTTTSRVMTRDGVSFKINIRGPVHHQEQDEDSVSGPSQDSESAIGMPSVHPPLILDH